MGDNNNYEEKCRICLSDGYINIADNTFEIASGDNVKLSEALEKFSCLTVIIYYL